MLSISIKQDGHSPEKTLMLGILASSPSFPLLSLPPLTTAVVLTTWSREMSAAAAAATGGSISATVAPKTSHSLAVSSERGDGGRRRRERVGACVRAGTDGQDRSELGPAAASDAASATEPIPPPSRGRAPLSPPRRVTKQLEWRSSRVR